MLKVFIFLFPIIINFLGGGMSFITANRFTEAGASKFFVASTQGVWACGYFFTSLLLGKIITEKRAVPFILTAACLLSVFSLGFIAVPGTNFQFIWILLYGFAMALYCSPFQIFMKRIGGGNRGVIYSTAMYTWSWSFGNAIGPFMFGLIPTWQAGFLLNAAMALVLAGLVIWTNHLVNKREASAQQELPSPSGLMDTSTNPYDGRPDLAWLGWLGLCVGLSVLSAVKTLQQDLLNDIGIDRSHSGPILSLINAVQAFAALSWIRTKTFVYKPLPCILSGVIGFISLAMMTMTQSRELFYLISGTYGIYTGYFYFMLVFHALVHPTKSAKYATINETFVGIVAVVSSPLSGLLAQATSVKFVFGTGAILTLLVTAIQFPVLLKTDRAFMAAKRLSKG